MVSKEEDVVAEVVAEARGLVCFGAMDTRVPVVIAHLADENDRLRAQLAKFSDELATWACEAEGAAVEMEAEISALRAKLAEAAALLDELRREFPKTVAHFEQIAKLRGAP